mgnify:FL=1
MVYARNKKASFDYFLETRYEAGIELVGTEVKSIKLGKVSIKESFVRIIKNEVFILNMNVTGYEYGNIHNIDEKRARKLLLNKKEIEKLKEKTSIKGYTIVPVSIYSKNRLVKVEIALAKGKKNYDKRESLKEKTIKREIEREHRN